MFQSLYDLVLPMYMGVIPRLIPPLTAKQSAPHVYGGDPSNLGYVVRTP